MGPGDYWGPPSEQPPLLAPSIVWAGFHLIVYVWWSLEYLTTLTLSLDRGSGEMVARRTLTVSRRLGAV